MRLLVLKSLPLPHKDAVLHLFVCVLVHFEALPQRQILERDSELAMSEILQSASISEKPSVAFCS